MIPATKRRSPIPIVTPKTRGV
ncbi:hypothetical protein CP10743SC13_0907A, partial [Chlamydia psittaci 10_743_SC13]